MKLYFSVALSCLALAAIAQPKATMKSVSGMPNNLKVSTPIVRFDAKAPMAMQQQMNAKMEKSFDLSKANVAVMGQHHAPASSADGVLYRPSSHSLKSGLFFSEDANSWGYSYYTPMLFSQAYQGTYDLVAGSKWTIGENDTDAESSWIDSSRNFSMAAAGMGVGGFYTPKINSKRSSYYYGSDDPDEGTNFTYSVNYKGDAVSAVEEGFPMSMGTYQIYGDMSLYTGWSNTLEFGARDYIAQDGTHIQSDMMLVDYGDLGGGFVLQYLEIPIVTHEKDALPFEGDEVLEVKLIDENVETGEYEVYYATIGAEDIFTDSQGIYLAHIGFVTTDEDGFETSIDPVLNGYVTLVISGFMQETVNAGLRMCWDNTASEETYAGGDFGPSHGAYDIWRDGVQNVDEEGNVLFYNTECIEPVLSLVGYFNALCAFETGEKVSYGEVPVEGGTAVTQYGDDGAPYNDYDVESSLGIEYIEILDAPEWVTAIEYDDSYFEDYSILMFFVAADALPAGVEGRQGTVVLCSNGEVTMDLVVTQGTTSINTIKGDAKNSTSYNLQGQVADAKSGLMVKDGKVIFVK